MEEMQGQQGDVGKLISNTGQGLTMLADLAGKTEGVDPQIPQRFGALVEEFTALIEALSGGSQEQAPPQSPPGTTSPEAGGNPGARPV